MSSSDRGPENVTVHRSQMALALARLAGVVNGLVAIRDRNEKLSDVAFTLVAQSWSDGRERIVEEEKWPDISRNWSVDDAILSLTTLHTYLEAFVVDDVAEVMTGIAPIGLHVKKRTA